MNQYRYLWYLLTFLALFAALVSLYWHLTMDWTILHSAGKAAFIPIPTIRHCSWRRSTSRWTPRPRSRSSTCVDSMLSCLSSSTTTTTTTAKICREFRDPEAAGAKFKFEGGKREVQREGGIQIAQVNYIETKDSKRREDALEECRGNQKCKANLYFATVAVVVFLHAIYNDGRYIYSGTGGCIANITHDCWID